MKALSGLEDRDAGGEGQSGAAKPTFLFGIGAQKAGTTWLYKYLRGHPQVHVPEVKELHYFDSLWLSSKKQFVERRRQILAQRQHGQEMRRALGKEMPPRAVRKLELSKALVAMYDAPPDDWSHYRDVVMKGRTDERCVADITPAYCNLTTDHLSQMLSAFAPAKILFIMRDPVQRMWSQIRMHCANKGTPENPVVPDDVIENLLGGRARVFWKRGNMDETLATLATLPQDHVKVLFHETMFQDDQIKELCDFLGVDFMAGQYETHVNQGSILAMTPEQRATLRWLNGPIYRAIHDAVGDDIPAAWDMGAMTAPRPAFLSVSEIHEQILQGRTT